jgi:hypothetical protein
MLLVATHASTGVAIRDAVAAVALRVAQRHAFGRGDVVSIEGAAGRVDMPTARASISVVLEHPCAELALRAAVTIGRPAGVDGPAVLRTRVVSIDELGARTVRAGVRADVPLLGAWTHRGLKRRGGLRRAGRGPLRRRRRVLGVWTSASHAAFLFLFALASTARRGVQINPLAGFADQRPNVRGASQCHALPQSSGSARSSGPVISPISLTIKHRQRGHTQTARRPWPSGCGAGCS